MRSFTRFLIFGLCFGLYNGASANVATTAGSNLTAYNGTGATNNAQWNSFANARGTMNDNLAAANNDNCEAVILRCATKKCSSGGCTTMDVTRPIVAGCVNSNQSCKVHGDALIDSIAGQIVAKANAKVEAERNAATAAAGAAVGVSQPDNSAQVAALQQQLADMQSQMQQSINSVQSQVQQQGAATAEAIAAAQAQANAAQAVTNPSTNYEGLSTLEQIALQNGVDSDIMAREKIMGKIVTSLEESDLAVQAMKKAMNDLFEYAGCDPYANDCSGPRRVKRFKELANDFFTPYDEVGDKLYDALVAAMTVGVDVSDALMLMNGACNMWGYYVCDACDEPSSGNPDEGIGDCVCTKDANDESSKNCYYRPAKKDGKVMPKQQNCRLVDMITGDDNTVRRTFIDNSTGTSGAERVECASDVVFSSGLFKKRNKKASIENIEILQRLVNQDAYKTCKKGDDCGMEYCEVKESADSYERLLTSVKQKKLSGVYAFNTLDSMSKSSGFKTSGSNPENEDDWSFFAPEYALCTVHAYNIGNNKNPTSSTDIAYMKEIIGLKSTLIAQQIKEQYDMVNAIVKRLKTQLEKSVYTTKMDILAGTESVSSSSGGSGNGMAIDGARECNYESPDSKYECFMENMRLVISETSSSKAKAQLNSDIAYMKSLPFNKTGSNTDVTALKGRDGGICKDISKASDKKTIAACANAWFQVLQQEDYDIKQAAKNNNAGGYMMMMPANK
ncbi:MAG: hypothetical protein K6B71_01070 [Alphaproteobacteria bacterium]|nr:hypothetical protein [Alphaproteobacteria bacterium]